jgi:hypothetical protein
MYRFNCRSIYRPSIECDMRIVGAVRRFEHDALVTGATMSHVKSQGPRPKVTLAATAREIAVGNCRQPIGTWERSASPVSTW